MNIVHRTFNKHHIKSLKKTSVITSKKFRKNIPHAQLTAMLDELHPLNNVTAAHLQVLDATHCLPMEQKQQFNFHQKKS